MRVPNDPLHRFSHVEIVQTDTKQIISRNRPAYELRIKLNPNQAQHLLRHSTCLHTGNLCYRQRNVHDGNEHLIFRQMVIEVTSVFRVTLRYNYLRLLKYTIILKCN